MIWDTLSPGAAAHLKRARAEEHLADDACKHFGTSSVLELCGRRFGFPVQSSQKVELQHGLFESEAWGKHPIVGRPHR